MLEPVGGMDMVRGHHRDSCPHHQAQQSRKWGAHMVLNKHITKLNNQDAQLIPVSQRLHPNDKLESAISLFALHLAVSKNVAIATNRKLLSSTY